MHAERLLAARMDAFTLQAAASPPPSAPVAPSPELLQLTATVEALNQSVKDMQRTLAVPPPAAMPAPVQPPSATMPQSAPASPLAPPRASYAAKAAASSKETGGPPPPSARSARDPTSKLCLVIVGKGPELEALAAVPPLARVAAASAFFQKALGLSAEAAGVADAFPLRPFASAPDRMRFFVRMSSSAQASAVVSSRHLLKGGPVAIFDHLSTDELVAHRQLWPLFVEARAKGLKACPPLH